MVPAFGLLIGKYFALTISSKHGIFENRERAYPKIHSFSIRFRKLEDVNKLYWCNLKEKPCEQGLD